MSYRASAWALDADHPQLRATHKWLLMLLAHCHNDETNACFPGMEYLVRRSLLSRATVKRHLSDLEQMGFIVRHIGGGRRRSDYVLFGVPRARLAVERVIDGYTHPAQDEPAPRASCEPSQLFEGAQDEPAPRASCEPSGGSQLEPRTGIEQELTKPRAEADSRLVDDSVVDTRIPADAVALGLAKIAELRAQLQPVADDAGEPMLLKAVAADG